MCADLRFYSCGSVSISYPRGKPFAYSPFRLTKKEPTRNVSGWVSLHRIYGFLFIAVTTTDQRTSDTAATRAVNLRLKHLRRDSTDFLSPRAHWQTSLPI